VQAPESFLPPTEAIVQAELFKKAIQCTGIILAKLDGTAMGRAIFGIKGKLGLPVKFVGVGEQLDDLEPFDPGAYVEALFRPPARLRAGLRHWRS
jgi:fused signal recognition particle receptor